MIDGVRTKQLKVIPDDRGFLYEMLRCDDEIFERFGQVYLTAVYPGIVKAWHYHKQQVDYFVCVSGMAKVVLYDDREGSPTRGEVNQFFLGDRNPMLLMIPKLVWHGMMGIGTTTTLIVNTPTWPYNAASPDEYRRPWDTPEIPYDWAPKNG